MNRLNESLEEFYKNKAKARPFPVGYCKLSNYIEKVLEMVEERHKRFSHKQYALVGSSASDVSSLLTKEMDYVYVIDIKGKVEDMPQSPGFAKFKVDITERGTWEDCLNKEGYLEPRKMSSLFKECIEEAVAKIEVEFPDGLPGLTDKVTKIEVGGGDSVAVTIAGSFGSLSWGIGRVTCDLVLVIGQEGLPSSNILPPWLLETPSIIDQWPTQETIEEIKQIGYGLVTKDVAEGDSPNTDDLSIMWSYSVSRIETCLMKHLDDKLLHKKLLIILKAIRLYEIRERSNFTPIITSYHMKTVFLHEAHSNPKEQDWTSYNIGKRFLSSLTRLVDCMKKNELSHFIFPKVNLFRGRQIGMISKFQKILNDPVKYFTDQIPRMGNPIDISISTPSEPEDNGINKQG